MYVRAITLPLKPDKIDEAVRLFRDSIAPMFQKRKGFQQGYLVGDRSAAKAVSITLWDTEADATSLDTSGFFTEWTGMLKSCLDGQAVRDQDEVYFQF
ncbi:MAG: hypothetical protein L0Y39_08700 [Methylococcaceae bacterium]|nr:hypothetical protein [Methylococcaceae bacterium]